MCTAITLNLNRRYCGRTLDLDRGLGEGIVVCPRNYEMTFTHLPAQARGYAIAGIGTVRAEYPLFYDAVNEKGLWMAGLSFPHFARYEIAEKGKLNLASYELIPFVLRECASIGEAADKLAQASVSADAFSAEFPPTPLHWILCGNDGCIVIESTEHGTQIFNDPIGVLTNAPGFEYHIQNLSNYLSLSPEPPTVRLGKESYVRAFSNGMGAIGLPGDSSSVSRFIRAAYAKFNSYIPEEEGLRIRQFFHVLSSVKQIKGNVKLEGGGLEYTVYTCCCDTENLVYYYTLYESSRIRAFDIKKENLDSNELSEYPMITDQCVEFQN